jgi:hypothetical protein
MIVLDAGTNELSSAQLELKYDPAIISVTALRAGEFFPDPITPITNPIERAGRVEFAVTIPEIDRPVTGKGSLALLSIKRVPTATGSAETTIEFLPKTSLRGQDTTTSLLKTTESLTIELETLDVPTPISITP